LVALVRVGTLLVSHPSRRHAGYGGYLGARGVKKLDPKKARVGILMCAWALTAYFFVRAAPQSK